MSIFLYTISGGKLQYEFPLPVFLADARATYFASGATVTYIISILRMATIFAIGMNGGDVQMSHFYYGPLYSIAWIVSYLLLVLGSQMIGQKITIKMPQRLRNFNLFSQTLLNQNLSVLNRH